ncbi:MAG: hypothetical protein H7175_09245, partial [Burkholderiales bacterium]|nr:hypothetical protein [Anaerolineae bacterium]
GRNFAVIGAAGAVIGGLVGAVIPLVLRFGGIPLEAIVPILMGNISSLIFIGVVAAVVYGRFKM